MLGRIEDEARRALEQRATRLRGSRGLAPRDPSGRWLDWEAMPVPPSEEERRELEAIDEALRRIEEGRYGACLACGGPLGLQRIRAIPEARYCVTCSGGRTTLD